MKNESHACINCSLYENCESDKEYKMFPMELDDDDCPDFIYNDTDEKTASDI